MKPLCSSWGLAEPELELPGVLIAHFSQFLHPLDEQIQQFPKVDWICKRGTPNKYCWCVYFWLAGLDSFADILPGPILRKMLKK